MSASQTCLGYTAFLAGGIYVQSIQSAQIGFSALNAIYTLHEICTSCNNTCNICKKIVINMYYIPIYLSFLIFNKTLQTYFLSYCVILRLIYKHYYICKFFMSHTPPMSSHPTSMGYSQKIQCFQKVLFLI